MPVTDSNLKVVELDGIDLGIEGAERFAQGGVEGVYGAIAIGNRVGWPIVDADFDGGLAFVPARIGGPAKGAGVFVELEKWSMLTEMATEEQFEGGFSGFEFVALAFEAFYFGENMGDLHTAFGERDTEFFRFNEDIGLTRHIRNGDDPFVADECGVNMLVGSCEFLDRMDMETSFVSKSGGADVG